MKSVIFDLGGVLIEWNPDRILEGYYTDAGLRAKLKSALFQHPDWLHFDRGTLQETELVARAAHRTGRPRTELEGLLGAVRESLDAKAGTVELLRRLAGRGVPLYCLSNVSPDMYSYLQQRHSFWGAFRGIVTSGETRLMKPEREIFELLLQRYRLHARDSVFVDDNMPNIEGARAMGINAVWFKDVEQCEREIEAHLAGG